MKKILVTGAHFTTAQAVIEELKNYSDVDIVYVGRKTTREGDDTRSVESQVLPEIGVKFIPLTTGRLQKAFTLYTIPSLLKIPIGFLQAFYIVFKQKPDVILSFGGYVAVPLVVVGWLFSIPIILHEQTLVTGLANKISAKFATKIATSFETENEFPQEKVVFTGNPIRQEILNPQKDNLSTEYQQFIADAKQENLPIIFVTGGNQGSHVINLAVEQVLDQLLKKAFVIHQTGDSKYKDYERLSVVDSSHYIVEKFIGSEMGAIISSADLVISRAGVNTLIELAYFAKPTLVIPVPYLYKDEQNKNAKYFQDLGLVKILPQSQLSGVSLFKKIKEMLKELPSLRLKSQQAKKVVIEDASRRVASETLNLINSAEIF